MSPYRPINPKTGLPMTDREWNRDLFARMRTELVTFAELAACPDLPRRSSASRTSARSRSAQPSGMLPA